MPLSHHFATPLSHALGSVSQLPSPLLAPLPGHIATGGSNHSVAHQRASSSDYSSNGYNALPSLDTHSPPLHAVEPAQYSNQHLELAAGHAPLQHQLSSADFDRVVPDYHAAAAPQTGLSVLGTNTQRAPLVRSVGSFLQQYQPQPEQQQAPTYAPYEVTNARAYSQPAAGLPPSAAPAPAANPQQLNHRAIHQQLQELQRQQQFLLSQLSANLNVQEQHVQQPQLVTQQSTNSDFPYSQYAQQQQQHDFSQVGARLPSYDQNNALPPPASDRQDSGVGNFGNALVFDQHTPIVGNHLSNSLAAMTHANTMTAEVAPALPPQHFSSGNLVDQHGAYNQRKPWLPYMPPQQQQHQLAEAMKAEHSNADEEDDEELHHEDEDDEYHQREDDEPDSARPLIRASGEVDKRGKRIYYCDVCRKPFNHKGTLRRHIRIHTGEKPFECDLCDKAFNQKIALITHLRTHTGEKPFKCTTCNQKFAYKNNLTAHLRKHSEKGEKPFVCNVCSKAFGYRGTLERHRKSHTHGSGSSSTSSSHKLENKHRMTGSSAASVASRNELNVSTDASSSEDYNSSTQYTDALSTPHITTADGTKLWHCDIAGCDRTFEKKEMFLQHLIQHAVKHETGATAHHQPQALHSYPVNMPSFNI